MIPVQIATERHTRKMPAPILRMSKPKKLIAFGWYGGKFSHLDWLLPKLPDCLHYCEPFAGSGAVLLNRKPSPVICRCNANKAPIRFLMSCLLAKIHNPKVDIRQSYIVANGEK